MILKIHDLNVAVGGEIAFSHSLASCGTVVDGQEQASWMRATVGYRRVDGRWMIVHEHWSVPFDPESGRALVELEP